MSLSKEQVRRYDRNILLKDVGVVGQEKILGGKVLVIGIGGLGSSVAFYLAAAGVGTIGLADSDIVDLTNLQRQIIHFTSDLNRDKVASAKDKMNKLNPDIKVITYRERVTSQNIADIIKDYDFVVDATDNFDTKFLINDVCVKEEKVFSHCGVLGFEGQTMTYVPGSACYRCLFNSPPPEDRVVSSADIGILGAAAGILGSIQATEALKYLLGIGELLTNTLLVFDALKMNVRTINIKPNNNCSVCG